MELDAAIKVAFDHRPRAQPEALGLKVLGHTLEDLVAKTVALKT